MAFAALLTLIGVALRSRALVTLAGLVVLGFTILWMVRQGQAASELTAGARGLGVGVANALGGGALLLLSALIMRGRGRRVPQHAYDERRYADGRYGPAAPDDRYDERAPYDPRTPYPPGTPEPWDAGRPGAEEWNPEPYSTGPAGPPAGPAAPGGHGGGAYGPREDTPTAPLPVTPPPPPPTQQQWRQPQQRPQQPQQPQPPPPTMPARQQPPHLRWSGPRNTGSRAPRSHNSPAGHNSQASPVSQTSRVSPTGPNAPNSPRRTGSRRPPPGHDSRITTAASRPPDHDRRITTAAPAPSPWPRPAHTHSGPCCTRTPHRRPPPANW